MPGATKEQSLQAQPVPLSEFPRGARRDVVAVLTDIDDTLTEAGRLPTASYSAMERLRAAGLLVIPVTGRSAGWCDLIARQWPVDGVVGENGAFYFRYDDAERRMRRRYAKTPRERAADRRRLQAIRRQVLAEVAGCAVSADQAYREADLAIDFCEDVPALPQGDVARICEIFKRHGATAKTSSIHVNGWFGGYDKLSTSLNMLTAEFGIGPDRCDKVVFVGDSPNDAPMFAHFPHAVGVANVRRYIGTMPANPRWVTAAECGDGFAELADCLIAAR